MNDELWTIGRMLSWTEQYFREKGIDTPRLDGEVLLSHMLGKDRIYCYTHYDQPLTKEELEHYKAMVISRVKGKSVAYITGKKEFMGLPFLVNEKVLVPRPDTETLVEAILDRLPRDGEGELLDLCTGSGAILLSLLHYLSGYTGLGIDISQEALEVAQQNCEHLSLSKRATLAKGDLFEALPRESTFDVIVSNPPYIPTKDMEGLAKEVLEEPILALDGGSDGLDFYRRILEGAPQHLKVGGILAVEIGIHQEQAIEEIAKSIGAYGEVEYFKDIQGIVRVLLWQKR